MIAAADRSARLLGLDALRGVAVLLMIEQHLGAWLWRGPDPEQSLGQYAVLIGVNALGGMAAPLFIMLSGAGAALYTLADRRDRGLAQRGLALIGFGLLLNLVTPSWFSPASWYVLHMLGLSLLLAVVWRRLATRWLLALAGAVLVVTPIVQTWLATPVLLDNTRMSDASLPGGVVRLMLAEGHFPVLPWLALALAGFVAGRWVAANRVRPVLWLAAAGGLIGLGGHLLLRSGVVAGPVVARAFAVHPFYPASVTVVTLLGAVALLLIAAVTAIERRRGIRPDHPLVALGCASLTLLFVHVLLFREVTQTRMLAVFATLPATSTLAVVIVVLVLATVLSLRWRRHDYRYGLEWILRRVGGATHPRMRVVAGSEPT